MSSRQQGRYSASFATIVAIVTLLFLFSLLKHHFDGPVTEVPGSQLTIARQPYKRKPLEAYHRLTETKPPHDTEKEKRIYAGLHIENIYDLSLKERVFMAEGWYWLKWTDTVNAILKENEIPQEAIVEFTNQVDASSMVVQANQPDPQRIDNEYSWQVFHFSGKFYIEDLELKAFPFDVLTLPIVLELKPESLSCYTGNRYGCISLILDKDTKGGSLGQYIDLNGYKTIASKSQEFLHQYNTNFGHGVLSAFASIRQSVIYQTDTSTAFWSYIFPLLVLVTVVVISPSLPGSLGDVRLAIPTTILLTLIFLQIGYQADLPALAYVSYLDWLYIYAYIVSASLFILFCWGTNAHANACAQGNEESVLRRINRVDLLVQAIALVGLVVMLAVGFMFEA